MGSMTWIHADANLAEINVIEYIKQADMQVKTGVGAELIDNTWSITMSDGEWQKHPIYEGHYVYSPWTEWGGPVSLVQHSTESGTITLQGPTWRGLLHQKRIYPPSGAGYLSITSVDANELIRQVIGSSFGSLVSVTSDTAGVDVSGNYRYQSYATGLQNTLREYDMRLNVVFNNVLQTVVLSAEPRNTLTDVEISQDYGINFTSTIGNVEHANHCLALGSGELENREVLNVYVTEDGYYTSMPAGMTEADVRTVILDYPNAEDTSDLLKSAIKTLQECAGKNGITVSDLQGVEAEMGDVLAVRDRVTGLTGTAEISNKILTIQTGVTNISMQIENVIVGGA